MGSLWIVLIIWAFARRSANYVVPIAIGLLSGIVFGTMIWVPYRDMPLLALIGGAITGIVAIALVRFVIKILGFCDKQIVCVRRRKWDWRKAASGLVVGIVLVFIITWVSDIARAMFYAGMGFWSAWRTAFSFNTVVWWNWGLPGLLSTSLFFLFVLGLGWGEVILRDEVDLPNQGIIDSGKNGISVGAAGIIAGLLFSLAIGLPCFLGAGTQAFEESCARGEFSSLLSGAKFGIGYGALLGLVFGQILGGFAWLRHTLLRLILYLDHKQIPWRLEEFLLYATKLHLLRRVGGGFEFIDQELQEYFERLDARKSKAGTEVTQCDSTIPINS